MAAAETTSAANRGLAATVVLSSMLSDFPLGPRWAAELMAAVLPPSAFRNVHVGHRNAFAAQLVRAVMNRGADLGGIIARVKVAYSVLDEGFDKDPQQQALVVDTTFDRLHELQQRESSLQGDMERAAKDDLDAKFRGLLDLFAFSQDVYYRTLGAPYVASDSLTRTGESLAPLADADGRVQVDRMVQLEAGRGIRPGTLSEGLDRHLRNCAAHHRFDVLSDERVKLWDMDSKGAYTWGPEEWKYWDLRNAVYRLSNTCSVLLLGLAAFDICHGRTIRARGWGDQEPRPRPLRRDVAKSELLDMADVHGFDVEAVTVDQDGALVIRLRVKGETVIEQDVEILSGSVGGVRGRYLQHVRTEWGSLRNQVYGFLQTTFDVHGGYDLVRVVVVAEDGKTDLGGLDAPADVRMAMIDGYESTEAIRSRLPTDTLAARDIPVVLKDPAM